MDKMFYTMPEACQKLGKSEDEVREMVTSGQLQEFRDKDELVFKVEQINLLAGVDEDTGDVVIDLSGASASSSTGLELTDNMDLTGAEGSDAAPAPAASSDLGLSAGLGLTGGSGMDLGDSGSAAGLSAFDTGADMAGDDDAGATRVGDGMDDDLTLETVGSGSGLMDLTRESDDTSLGAEILDDEVREEIAYRKGYISRQQLVHLGERMQKTGYGEYLHGEAVAIGMVMAARMSARCGWISGGDVNRVCQMLLAAGLPTVAPAWSVRIQRRAKNW